MHLTSLAERRRKRRWYLENQTYARRRCRENYHANIERERNRARARRAAMPDANRIAVAAWRAAHPDYQREWRARRRFNAAWSKWTTQLAESRRAVAALEAEA